MTLTPGTRLGPYLITAQIGVGGMGEVYRATDTKLKREVAVKVLPASLAADPDRLARFQREAEVLASLNHPNIAAIYGLEEGPADGDSARAGEGGHHVRALIMELVEGPTLAERIAQGPGGPNQPPPRLRRSAEADAKAEGPPLRTEEMRAAGRRGGTLDRVGAPPIPMDEALAIAKQMADALEAAHERGVMHRDLKPANVKVRPDGMVKVLDFGLAKLNAPNDPNDPNGPNSPNDPNASQSPTITTPAMMTQAGMILGTAAYMSPEQARGKTVDKRADIWAFGCVLFEMLTGQRAFAGDEVSDTLASVLAREPDWALLPADVPAALRHLLRRCLDKDPRRRVADISTALFVLDEVERATRSASDVDEVGRVPRLVRRSLGEGGSGPADPDPAVVQQQLQQQTDAAVAAVRRGLARTMRRRVVIAGAAALVVGASAGAAVWSAMRPAPPPLPETRTEIVTPATAYPVSFALSPDGRQIVFVASGDGASRLWLRSLASATAQPLADTEGAVYPFWSPDSRSVGFFADGRLKRIDTGGGAPQTLATATSGRGGTWNADGVILFTPSALGPLFRVPASGGGAAAVAKLDRESNQHYPFFLPDGRHFLYFEQGTSETGGIYLSSLESEETKRLTPAEYSGVYLSSGWLLWVRAGTLVAQRLDLERKALTGDPVTLADPVAVETNFGASAVSVSATGLVAYRTGGASPRQLAWFDRSGKALGAMGAPDENNLGAPSVSPDGRRVAVRRTLQGNTDIFLVDDTRTTRFTFDAAIDRLPIWSPDGRRIVFDSNRKGRRDIYQKPSSGAGVEELLVESDQDKILSDWSEDGRFLLYFSVDPQTDRDLWVLPMDGDRKPWVFLKTSFSEKVGQFSPDGRWIAYVSNESGRLEIFVRPFVEPTAPGATGNAAGAAGGQWQVSEAGGIYPRWRPDGRELYYIGPDGEMMAAPVTATGTTLEPGTPVVLFPTRIFGGGVDNQQHWQYDVTRDGRFLINTVLDEDAAPITLLQNWQPGN